MKTAYQVTTGGSFSGGVLPAGPLRDGITELKRELTDGYLGALTDLMFHSEQLTEADRRELDRLVSLRHTLNQSADALLERVRGRARVRVTAEWELAKQAVREQQKKLVEHHEQIAALTRELNRAAEAKGLAVAARDAVQEEGRRLSRYAEKAERDRVSKLLQKREAECDRAAKEHGNLQQQINFATLTGLKPLMEKLNELMGEEARLNHYVTGASYTTELGLVVPASRPL
jgi:chromosome segregation ATPase